MFHLEKDSSATFIIYEAGLNHNGDLALGTHNISYTHTDKGISELLRVYDETFAIIKSTLEHRDLYERLQSEVLVPLFKIR